MRRFATALLALLFLTALAACKVDNLSSPATSTPGAQGSSTPTAGPGVSRTPEAVPGAVPEGAVAVDQTAALGQITRVASQTPETVGLRKLLDAFCQEGVMIIQTSQEAIYAALPCDRFWDDEAKQHFLNQQVAITLEVSQERFRVLLQTPEGAQAEFTVGGIWLR
jgi:hypothetical protein